MTSLPFVDEHSVDVAAAPDAVWTALWRIMGPAPSDENESQSPSYRGTPSTLTTKTFEIVRKGDVEAPSVWASDVPNELDAIAMRALAKERGERFATARDMAGNNKPERM